MSKDLSKVIAERVLSLKKPREAWSAFAKRIGLTPQVVSNWKTEETGASLDKIATVLTHVPRLSGTWLLSGRPPMYMPDGNEAVRLEVIQMVADGTVDGDVLRSLATSAAADDPDLDVDVAMPGGDDGERRQDPT